MSVQHIFVQYVTCYCFVKKKLYKIIFKFPKVFEETAGLLKLVIYEFISSYIKI